MEVSISHSLTQIFASPIFLGDPLLTAADAIQVGLEAARVDIDLQEASGEYRTLSSALAEERTSDQRTWRCVDIKSHPGSTPQWEWQRSEDASPIPPQVRSALCRSNRRLVVTYPPGTMVLGRDTATIVQVTLWFQSEEVSFRDVNIPLDTDPGKLTPWIVSTLAEVQSALCVALATVSRSTSVFNIRNTFNGLVDKDAQSFLRNALEALDIWLKEVIKPEFHEGNISAYHFLNQFYWVTRAPERTTGRNPVLAQVKPVFLTKQLSLLADEWREPDFSAYRLSTSAQNDIDSISDSCFDSCSLFSSFPADTGISLYIEQYPKELIKEANPTDSLLQFRRLTQRAQRRAAKEAGLLDVTDHNLFSVPVLVGQNTLFVTAMSLPMKLDAHKRLLLASQIQALGGIMQLQAQHFELEQESKRERMFDLEQSDLPHYIHRAEVIQAVVQPLPILMSTIQHFYDELSRTLLKDEGQQRFKELRDARNLYNEVMEMGKHLSSQAKDLADVNLLQVVEEAIGKLPVRARRPTREFTIPPHWTVRANESLLISCIAEILLTANEGCPGRNPPKLRIDMDEENYVQICFIVEPGSKQFAELNPLRKEIRNAALDIVREMRSIVQTNCQLRSGEVACCILKFPNVATPEHQDVIER